MDILVKITQTRCITLVPTFMILLIETLKHCSYMIYVYLGSLFSYYENNHSKYYFRIEIC